MTGKCIACDKRLNLKNHVNYEYDAGGELWCKECAKEEKEHIKKEQEGVR